MDSGKLESSKEEFIMRKIMISIALVALMLTGCSKNEGKTTTVESIATNTVATIGDASADATTEEVVENKEEPASEKETLEAETTTEAVPATTEIGGGKKKAEETTEEKKPNTTESTKPSTNHSNSGSASSGQSTTPKPSNSGNSSNGSSSSGSSNSTPSQKPSTPATTEAPTAQHQHNYNVWVKTKDAWDETVIDTPEQRIDYPEQGYYAPAKRCNTCCQVFTSSDEFRAHATYGGGSCPADGYGTTQVWVKTRDPYTEVIPAKTHTVHHDEEGYWKCECGARK